MRLINSKNGIKALAGLCAIAAVVCLAGRLPVLLNGSGEAFTALAVGLTLPDGARSAMRGEYQKEKTSSNSSSSDAVSVPSGEDLSPNTVAQEVSSAAASSNAVSSRTSGTEGGYPIVEKLLTAAGIQYNNFYVKNTNNTQIDIGQELSKRPDINIVKNGTPQVLIVHTHTCEGYLTQDNGVYPADFYPRTTDNNYNVVAVGNAIAQKLTDAGIGVIHDTTVHDNPSYNGSYYRSEDTVKRNLEQYPSIQVVLDIHRDALGTNETGRVKPTFVAGGKKAAQIMIMTCCDDDGTWDFPDWEYNLRFALQLQQAAESHYPGMTRPMYFCPGQYNLHLSHGALLIEVGSDANTIDETVYSGSLLGEVLSGVLNNLTE